MAPTSAASQVPEKNGTDIGRLTSARKNGSDIDRLTGAPQIGLLFRSLQFRAGFWATEGTAGFMSTAPESARREESGSGSPRCLCQMGSMKTHFVATKSAPS